jgi:hypothetical protein
MTNTWKADEETRKADEILRKLSPREAHARNQANAAAFAATKQPIKFNIHQLMDIAAKALAERWRKGVL